MTRHSGLPIVTFALLFVLTAFAEGQQGTRASMAGRSERRAAPAFRLTDASGKPINLSDFRGRPVVVNLWATTCGGCVKELPEFVALDRSHRSKGLTIIGVSMDVLYNDLKSTREAWDRVKPFVETHAMRYPVVVDDGSVEKGFNVTALPATYLIDKAGSIAAVYIGVVDPADLQTNVDRLLNER